MFPNDFALDDIVVVPSCTCTTTLVSGGGGAVGSADPITQVSTDGGATYYAAIIINGPDVHATIPGTEWIAFNSTGYGLQYTDMFFRVTFQLPAGFSNPQLSLSVFADNVATGILNGVQIGGQPFAETNSNFQNPPSIFTATDPALFQVGQNVLTIWLYNFHDPSGLDYQATVTFIAGPSTYSISTSSSPPSGGSTSGGGTYACGSNVTVCATANACYSFVNWTVNSSVVSTSACYSFTVTGNETLVANFSLITYSISTSSSPPSGGSTSGGGTYACGSNVTVCATANACYSFVNWTVNSSVVSTSACYSFTVTGNETLVANFAPVPFTAGDIVVYRIGDGTAQLTNIGSIVYLDEYTTTGTNNRAPVQSVLMPTNFFGAYYPLIANGTATAEGEMTRSVDGRFLVVPGYGARLGGGSGVLSGNSATTVPRIYALVGGNGNIDTTTAQTNSLSDPPENPRSGASTDGTNLWISGDPGGLRYTTRGSNLCTQLTTQIVNLRQIHIYGNYTNAAVTNLYFSTGTTNYPIRLGTITNAMPVESSGAFMQSLTNMPTTGALSPYGFVMFEENGSRFSFDTLYLVSNTNNVPNLYKYCLDSGGWTLYGTGITAENARGLTGSIGSDGNVHLYMVTAPTAGSGAFTGGGYVLAYTDSAGFDQPMTNDGDDIGDVNDWIVTAPINEVCRGIAFAPQGGDPFPSGPGRISVGPICGFLISGVSGCPFTPSNFVYSVANPGTSTVSWVASVDQPWVTLSTPGGTLPSGTANSLTVTLNGGVTSLGLGMNSATITFTSTTNHIGDTTRPVSLNISALVVTSQPQSLTVYSGNPACFSVTAYSCAPLYYQWQKSGTNLVNGGNVSGATNNTLTLIPTTTTDAGNYTVIISNAYGSVISSVATLTVVDPFACWQTHYFGSTNSANGAPGVDADGTGMSNTNKFLAGFNPTNAAAYAHIISIVETGDDINVTYLGANGDNTYSPGIASRTNVLEFTAGAADGSYSNNFASTGVTNILSGGHGLGTTTTAVDVSGAIGTNRYYRIRVLAP